MLSAQNTGNNQAGLTLLEILVSLVIVAILAVSVGMLILPKVLERTRDTRRLSDLEYLGRALNSYSTDKGYYPPSSTQAVSPWVCALTISSYGDCAQLQTELAPYLTKVVFDPMDKEVAGGNTNCSSSPCYMYGTSPNDHIDYCLCAALEGSPPQPKTNFCQALVPYGNYCITNVSN